MRAFGWSLHDLDRTHVESLFPFIRRFGQTGGVVEPRSGRVYADQVSWL